MHNSCKKCGKYINSTSGFCPDCGGGFTLTGGNDYTPRGWECPKCGNVMAPFISFCVICNRTNKQVDNTLDYRIPSDYLDYVNIKCDGITFSTNNTNDKTNSPTNSEKLRQFWEEE